MPAIVVRPPSPRLAEGLVTHIDRSPVDADVAAEQWHNYVQVFRDAGWDVIEAPATPDCPDGVFIEDQILVYGDTAVLCRSGAPERRAEQTGLEELLRAAGYRVVAMTEPGCLDGGDVLKHDGVMWIGDSGPVARTNAEGVRQVREALAHTGVDVRVMSNLKALHLKSSLTALPTGEIIGWDPVVDEPQAWPGYRSAPEEPGAHVVLLGGRRLLMAASAPQTTEQLRDEGYDVTCVDISEFEKLEGCVTCLSVRLRDASVI